MAKQPTSIKTFANEDAATKYMTMKNRANVCGWLWALVEGPSNDWCVVDIATAIELGNGYTWSAR